MKATTDVTASVGHARQSRAPGLTLERFFTKPGVDPFSQVEWDTRKAEIKSPDGAKVIFTMDSVEAPKDWSQVAVDIAADKYFRKAGVPSGTGQETSVRQMIARVVKAIVESGKRQGRYFASAEDAQAFADELTYLLVTQRGAFNSPVWFNCGLYEAYGIEGGPSGLWAMNLDTNQTFEVPNCYVRPQVSACFIQSIDDDLMDIADFVKREMRLFKYGSGSGANFSSLRAEGELLSGGGTSSGMMSFLDVFDKAAGAIKSGGTTRRAAKMVVVNVDHPDIERFVEWKAREEDKVLALIKAGYSSDFNGEAYRTISGQNANNSVRVTDEFMHAVIHDKKWETKWRKSGQVAKTLDAKGLFRKIAKAAHRCADPGLQFDTVINLWNPVSNSGRINASNPCSEYMSLDDTACNLASLNLVKFLRRETAKDGGVYYTFDVKAYRHAARIFTLAQEILVDHASYPTQEIAQNAHDFRQLGLGYANLGAMLMLMGVPYDSHMGYGIAAALTAILTGTGYDTSAEIASSKGPFPGFAHNREPMLKVMGMHRDHAYKIDRACPSYLLEAAAQTWDSACANGEAWGYRNAQATVIAPTGTIGLMMDCDTTGVEPDFALVKSKKLAGGGFLQIVNKSVQAALEVLGYTAVEIAAITFYLKGTRSLTGSQPVNAETLAVKGLSAAELVAVEAALDRSTSLKHALSAAIKRDGFKAEEFLLAGFTKDQIDQSNDVIFGRSTLEGAPGLRPEHLPVFDCATKCGKGVRFIQPMAHIKMLEAVQPFVSGSISKTVNCPKETTVEDIENLYMEAWKRGLKCIAIYRDGSKEAQVLSSSGGKDDAKTAEAKKEEPKVAEAKPEVVKDDRSGHAPPPTRRHRLSKKRPDGINQEITVGGQKLYVRTGEYADGSCGEVFIDLHKAGSSLRGNMNCFAIAISLGLQHGIPLSTFIKAFAHTRFDGGPVDHPHIKMASSVLDAVFRLLAFEYEGEDGLEYVQKKPTPEEFAEHQARKILRRMVNNAKSPSELLAVLKGGAPMQAALSSSVSSNGNGHSSSNGDARGREGVQGERHGRCADVHPLRQSHDQDRFVRDMLFVRTDNRLLLVVD